MMNAVQQSETLMTVTEVADYLQVSESLVYKMAEDGRLPCVRIGKKLLRFRKSEIDAHFSRLRD
jgi:excisionase family DNA binding protein